MDGDHGDIRWGEYENLESKRISRN